ncbi:MAG: type II toxin-antitoxin system HicA family toxin [Nanoarchaeota archaeon]|nr:type II toxin-antitoxin system HicA family toxin [Nanoarchaeota archaeon]
MHQRSSHIRYKHSDGRITVVPVHGNEKIGKGLLKDYFLFTFNIIFQILLFPAG